MYLTQHNNKNAYVLDIEADDLKATKIWVVCLENLVTGEQLYFRDKGIFNEWLTETKPVLIGHNIISFDVPTLNRLWGCGIDLASRTSEASGDARERSDRASVITLVDTLVLGRLYHPSIEGGHSLSAWGKRLKLPKLDYNDWSQYSEEMLTYCRQDVKLTAEVYRQLTAKMRKMGFSELSCDIEHKIRIIIDEQERNGFWFNKQGAEDLRRELRHKQADLAEQIQKLFPPTLTHIKRCVLRRRKDGCYPSRYGEALQKYDFVETNEKEGWYDCYEYQPFNLGSPKQRVDRLLALGWKPTNFTKTKSEEYPDGFPKVDEETLIKLSESEQLPEDHRPAVKALAEWLVLQGRASMIETWLSYVGPDSKIHGKVNSCGAATRRCTHSQPNSANIPSGAKAAYGHECRGLWGIEPNKGFIQVGVDASGLENVGLLHYLNNPKATQILLNPKPNDVHTSNARALTEALGFEVDREWGAKTSFFALIFGAGDAKLGSIVKAGPKEGAIIRETIIKNIPGFDNLLKDVEDEFFRTGGILKTVDGGFVRCDRLNAALNYLVQSSGAIVMKLACIILYEEAKKQDLWFELMATVHDEWQMCCKEEDGTRLGELAVWSMTEAAKRLKFNATLSGEYKLGKSWAECH